MPLDPAAAPSLDDLFEALATRVTGAYGLSDFTQLEHALQAAALAEAEDLLSAVGDVVRLEGEGQIDAVTGVSVSGPAYVFHLIETLAEGGVAQGLPKALAMQLAKATVAGAGALAMEAEDDPAQLRGNVTSPNGTTQAALEVLMDGAAGFPALLPRAVAAATQRSKALSGG